MCIDTHISLSFKVLRSKAKSLNVILVALASLILWPLSILLNVPLWLAGFPICYALAIREAWVLLPSKYFPGRTVTAWRYGWAQAVYGNWEDGVTGPEWWTTGKVLWRAAFVWSAWRNPTNNLRFLPLLNPVIVPARVQYRGNADDPSRKSAIGRRRVEWSFTWQGIYTGLVVRWQVTATHHSQIRIGWKLLPKDRNGVSPEDYRSIRCPFGVQFHAWRKS